MAALVPDAIAGPLLAKAKREGRTITDVVTEALAAYTGVPLTRQEALPLPTS